MGFREYLGTPAVDVDQDGVISEEEAEAVCSIDLEPFGASYQYATSIAQIIGLNVTSYGSDGSVTVTWNPHGGADCYEVRANYFDGTVDGYSEVVDYSEDTNQCELSPCESDRGYKYLMVCVLARDENWEATARSTYLVVDLQNSTCRQLATFACSNLQGIDKFEHLTYLKAVHHNIQSLDVSSNQGLSSIEVQYNGMTSINLPKYPSGFARCDIHEGNPNLVVKVNGSTVVETTIPVPLEKLPDNSVAYSGKSYTAKDFYTFDSAKVTLEDDVARKNAGCYSVLATCNDGYVFDGGSYTYGMYYEICQTTQKPSMSTATKTVKKKKVKKKAVETSAIAVTGAKTTKKFTKVSGSSKLTVNATTGKIKVKKKTKKGTYKITVKLTCAETNNYAGASVTKTIKVKVK